MHQNSSKYTYEKVLKRFMRAYKAQKDLRSGYSLHRHSRSQAESTVSVLVDDDEE